MSIPEAFDVNPKTRTEAQNVWLPKFINAINDAVREGREPFVQRNVDTQTLTVAEFIDQHYVPRYYQAETIAAIKSPDGRSKMKLLRRDLGELRLKQLESEVVVDDYKKQLQAKGLGARRQLDLPLPTTRPSTSAFAARRVSKMLEMSVPHSRVHWSPNHKL
jgi:hypothetical protein